MFGLERGKGGSLAVWLILGVLALAFGLTFGLPSDQLSMGTSGLLKVHGENVTKEDFFYQKRAISTVVPLAEGEQARAMGVREEVLEAVIERLILIEVGARLGLAIETHDAELLTKDGFYLVLGEDQPWPWAMDERFDYEHFKSILPRFAVNEARYLELQRQELLARQVRDLLWASITIPESELWAKYEKDQNQLSLRYVRFPVADFSEIVDPTADEIDAYIQNNADALQEAWETNQARFLKLPAQVDLRLIEFTKPIAPPEGSPEEMLTEHEARLEAARAAAVAARERIVSGGEAFANVAREVSRDPDTARSGGHYGWTQVTDFGSGLEPIIDETARELEDNQVSEVIEGEEGIYLIMVAGHREGDVAEDVAKRELAAEAVRSARGRELAKRAAEEALLAVKDGADLDSLFTDAKPALGGPENMGENIEDYAPGGAPVGEPERKVEETGLFARGQTIPGIGTQPLLTNAAWEGEAEAPIIDQVFDVPGGFLIAAVDERQTATEEGFAEARTELYRELAQQRANSVISGFTKHQCFLAKATVDIRVNEKQVERLMTYSDVPKDEEDAPLLPPYHVCDRVGDRGGLLRMAMMMRGGGGGAPPG